MNYTVVAEKVIEVINLYRNDKDLYFENPPEVKMNQILYAYGSNDEIKQMIQDLEHEYDIDLYNADAGEMTIREFISLVTRLALGKQPLEGKKNEVVCEGCQNRFKVEHIEECTYELFAWGRHVGTHILCDNCVNEGVSNVHQT